MRTRKLKGGRKEEGGRKGKKVGGRNEENEKVEGTGIEGRKGRREKMEGKDEEKVERIDMWRRKKVVMRKGSKGEEEG
jgi:hypothetical protein